MDRRPEINISAIPVAGIGGAGLLVVALSMAAEFPEARWLLTGGVVEVMSRDGSETRTSRPT